MIPKLIEYATKIAIHMYDLQIQQKSSIDKMKLLTKDNRSMCQLNRRKGNFSSR